MAPESPRRLHFEHPLALTALDRDGPSPVALTLDPDQCAAMARFLGIPAVEALAFAGEIAPRGADGWRLTGRLTGRAVQDCVVTLEPVEETIASDIERLYRPAGPADSVEMLEIGPEDLDAPEPVGSTLDLAGVMAEAVALALDPYPRAPAAAGFAGHVHAGPGITPLTDEALRPFSKLTSLRARLREPGGDGGG